MINSDTSPTSRLFKIGLVIFLTLMVLIGLLIGFAPTIASTDWGRTQVVRVLNAQIPGTLNIERLQLAWWGNQNIEGLDLQDPSGKRVVHVEHIETETPLWRLLFNKTSLSSLSISNLNAMLTQDAQGVSNLQKALSFTQGDATKTAFDPIVIKDVNAKFNVKTQEGPITAHMTGATQENNLLGYFEIDAVLEGLNSRQWIDLRERGVQSWNSSENEAKANINITLTNFPVRMLDRIFALYDPSLNRVFQTALGDTLNLTIKNHITGAKSQFEMQVEASQVVGAFSGQIVDGQMTLTQPGSIRWNITPDFFQQLVKRENRPPFFRLEDPADLTLTIDELSIPLDKDRRLSLEECRFRARADLTQITLLGDSRYDPLVLQNFTAYIDASDKNRGLLFSIQTTPTQNNQSFKVDLKGIVASPSKQFPFSQLFGPNTDILLNLDAIPMQLVDQIAGTDNLFVDALGPTGNFSLHLYNKESTDFDIDVTAQTDKLTIPTLKLKLGEQLELANEATIQYVLSDPLFNHLMPESFTLQSERDMPVYLSLHRFSMPVNLSSSTEPLFNLQKAKFDADFSTKGIRLSGLPFFGNARFTNFNLHLVGKSSNQIHTYIQASMESLNSQGLTPAALGGSAHISLESITSFTEKGTLEFPSITAKFESDLGTFNMCCKVTEEGKFLFTEPAKLQYTLTKEAMADLGLAKNAQSKLENPTPITMTIEPKSSSPNASGWGALHLGGKLTISGLTMTTPTNAKVSLYDLLLPWEIDGEDNSMTVHIGGKTSIGTEGKKGSVKGQIKLLNWHTNGKFDLEKSTLEAFAHFNDIPLVFLTTLSGYEDVTSIFGPTIDLELIAKLHQEKTAKGKIDLTFATELLHGNAKLKVDDAITLDNPLQPIEIYWSLTPDAFAAFRRVLKGASAELAEDPLCLTDPTTITAKITSLNLPFRKTNPWTNGGITASATIGRLAINDHKRGHSNTFEDIFAHFTSTNLADSIAFNLRAKDAQRSHYPQSELTFNGYMKNAFTSWGQWNPEGLALIVESRAKDLPVVTLSNLLLFDTKMQERIDALVGERLDAQVNIQMQRMNGTIDATLNGSNGRVSLNALLTDGMLTLKQPFEAEVAVTPKLSKAILQDIVPLFSSAISSQQPLKITIDPTGFSIPLRPLDIAQAEISKASIALGKITFKNEGELGAVLELLKPIDSDTPSVWFTPLYFNMHNGIIRCERLDMLVADLYPIATWGKVDLIKEKVSMTVGLTAQALQQAFTIRNLDPEYILQIPVKGPMGNVQIDKSKATTRISALVAQTQGGLKGKIFGTVLQMAAGDGNDPAPPPPTTTPLPWSQTNQQEPAEQERSSMQMIKDGASSIFRDLFDK